MKLVKWLDGKMQDKVNWSRAHLETIEAVRVLMLLGSTALVERKSIRRAEGGIDRLLNSLPPRMLGTELGLHTSYSISLLTQDEGQIDMLNRFARQSVSNWKKLQGWRSERLTVMDGDTHSE